MKISPSRRWYLIALLITFLGPIIGTFSIIRILNTPAKIDIPIQSMATSQIEIPKTGMYTLWAKPSATVEHTFEAAYETGENVEELSTATYTFKHKQTNTVVKLIKTAPFPLVNWFKIQRSELRIPIANATFPKKGIYIANISSTQFPLALSLGYPSIHQIYKSILINIILIFSTIIIGPLIAISVLIARNAARPAPPSEEILDENRGTNNILAALCHISGFTLFLYPFGHIITPLFIWLFFKEDYPAVNQHGKAVLNFQISITLYYLLLGILVFFIIGIPLIILLLIYQLLAMIIGGVTAACGKPFRYPLSLEFIK